MLSVKHVTKAHLPLLSQEQKRVICAVVKYKRLLTQKLELNDSPTIYVGFSNALKNTAGHCTTNIQSKESTIVFSNNFLREPRFDKTVAHEVSHAFQRILYPHSRPHGPQFRRIMSLTGYSPDRCHSYATKSRKRRRTTMRYTCDCGQQYNLGLNLQVKIYLGKFYRCRICRQRLNYANVFGIRELPLYLRLKLRQLGVSK